MSRPEISYKNPIQTLNERHGGGLEFEMVGEPVLKSDQTWKFTMCTEVDGIKFNGIGKNKKTAKNIAAKKALMQLYNVRCVADKQDSEDNNFFSQGPKRGFNNSGFGSGGFNQGLGGSGYRFNYDLGGSGYGDSHESGYMPQEKAGFDQGAPAFDRGFDQRAPAFDRGFDQRALPFDRGFDQCASSFDRGLRTQGPGGVGPRGPTMGRGRGRGILGLSDMFEQGCNPMFSEPSGYGEQRNGGFDNHDSTGKNGFGRGGYRNQEGPGFGGGDNRGKEGSRFGGSGYRGQGGPGFGPRGYMGQEEPGFGGGGYRGQEEPGFRGSGFGDQEGPIFREGGKRGQEGPGFGRGGFRGQERPHFGDGGGYRDREVPGFGGGGYRNQEGPGFGGGGYMGQEGSGLRGGGNIGQEGPGFGGGYRDQGGPGFHDDRGNSYDRPRDTRSNVGRYDKGGSEGFMYGSRNLCDNARRNEYEHDSMSDSGQEFRYDMYGNPVEKQSDKPYYTSKNPSQLLHECEPGVKFQEKREDKTEAEAWFICEADFAERGHFKGEGKSKKVAKANCAKEVLEALYNTKCVSEEELQNYEDLDDS